MESFSIMSVREALHFSNAIYKKSPDLSCEKKKRKKKKRKRKKKKKKKKEKKKKKSGE